MRERVDRTRLHAFMRALAVATRRPLQVDLVGGATAVLEGWRDSTVDVDLRFGDDSDTVLRAIPTIKEQLDMNVELASPADFMPAQSSASTEASVSMRLEMDVSVDSSLWNSKPVM